MIIEFPVAKGGLTFETLWYEKYMQIMNFHFVSLIQNKDLDKKGIKMHNRHNTFMNAKTKLCLLDAS